MSVASPSTCRASSRQIARATALVVQIAFNPRYLADGVSAVEGDSIRIRVIDGLKPSVISSVGDDTFVYLLMPVRV